jgi:putative DNA methylase
VGLLGSGESQKEVGHLYPLSTDSSLRLAYLWAHTLPCPNPSCRVTVPLLKQRWLVRSTNRSVAVNLLPTDVGVRFEVVEGNGISGDPSEGTIKNGAMRCPVCLQGVYDQDKIKDACCKSVGVQPICVVAVKDGESKRYIPFSTQDLEAVKQAERAYEALSKTSVGGISVVPDELVGTDYEWALTVSLFGLKKWSQQHTARQLLALVAFSSWIREAPISEDAEYGVAVRAMLTMAHGRLADKCAAHCRWRSDGEYVENTFCRQALSMSWDYAEINPFSGQMGDWTGCLDWVLRNIEALSTIATPASVQRGSATRLPIESESIHSVLTDPPYYDAVPYADLSDFFYVWHKRCMRHVLPDLYRTPVTPKAEELVQQSARYTAAPKRKKTREFFERGMGDAFAEMARVLCDDGIIGVMFAHKTTTAWEALIKGLNDAGGQVTSTWPIHTEMKARLRAKRSAALARSTTCD